MGELPEVVRATVRGVPDVVAIAARGLREGDFWTSQTDRGGLYLHPGSLVTDRRPLVLIDPEDTEQVERLARAFDEAWGGCAGGRDIALAAALRSLAQPTPPEPTGLGAVVRDANGRQWVRSHINIVREPWTRPSVSGTFAYDAIPQPVIVLAEGWSE